MKLLITNDDGYDAAGMQELVTVLRKRFECWVVAPDGGRSCCSHSVSNGEPLTVVARGERDWTVNGTPADCVRIGLMVLGLKPDWILSGVNQGGNLGIDTLYSGTVAAAREAAILGYPSIALSQFMRRDIARDWTQSARHAFYVLEKIWKMELARGHFWNVNLPALPPIEDAHVPGHSFPITECELERAPLGISFAKVDSDTNDRELVSEASMKVLYQSNYPMRPRSEGTDVDLCFRGHATLTLLATGWHSMPTVCKQRAD